MVSLKSKFCQHLIYCGSAGFSNTAMTLQSRSFETSFIEFANLFGRMQRRDRNGFEDFVID